MENRKKIKIGITGNIGCGKSEVVRLLKEYPNTLLIDTDSLAREIAMRDGVAQQITELVGFCVDMKNAHDRKKLAGILFGDTAILERYEQIVHPIVWREVDEQFQKMKQGICIVESAILFEKHTESHYEKIITVTCDEAVQIARLRDGARKMDEAMIKTCIAHQFPQSEKIERSDFVIDNSGTKELLEQKVFNLYQQLNQLIMVKKEAKALFVLSADPITKGHEWLIEQAAAEYQELVVGISVNPTKKTMFTLEERLAMVREVVPSGVAVVAFDDVYSVDYAESIGATVMIRGIRNATDREYEDVMKRINLRINPSVVTEYLYAPEHLTEVSSSIVKAMIGPRKWESVVADYVSPSVLARILAKVSPFFSKLQELGAQGDPVEFWKKVITPYLGKDRFHHNLEHVATMAFDVREFAASTKHATELEFAIWFHDYFNETKERMNENEERSCEIAITIASELGLSDAFCEQVTHFIMSTKHVGGINHKDAQIMCDLDLRILGANTRLFDEYENSIRKEYEHVPVSIFNEVRAHILQQFLKRDRIYYTDAYYEKYETAARENLKRSIARFTNQ